jgi:hypothetical protein
MEEMNMQITEEPSPSDPTRQTNRRRRKTRHFWIGLIAIIVVIVIVVSLGVCTTLLYIDQGNRGVRLDIQGVKADVSDLRQTVSQIQTAQNKQLTAPAPTQTPVPNNGNPVVLDIRWVGKSRNGAYLSMVSLQFPDGSVKQYYIAPEEAGLWRIGDQIDVSNIQITTLIDQRKYVPTE